MPKTYYAPYVAAWVEGSQDEIRRFAEDLSERIDVPCGWSVTDGEEPRLKACVTVRENAARAARDTAHGRRMALDHRFLTICPRPELTWDETESDPLIHEHGTIFAWGQGRATAINKFIAALSERIQAKCDWSYAGGRAHLDTLPAYKSIAVQALRDERWMSKFLVEYSEQSWQDGTYFRIDTIP